MPPLRVLVVDDSVVIRKMISDILSEDPELEVAGSASDGKIALSKIIHLSPDLVTLDIEMPVLNGLETLAEIRKISPHLPVIMFSTLTERGAGATLEALALGASDYVTKPSNTMSTDEARQKIRTEMIPKIKALCRRFSFQPGAGSESGAKSGSQASSAAAQRQRCQSRLAPRGDSAGSGARIAENRNRGHRHFHRRTQRTGRGIARNSERPASADRHRAAHATDIYADAGGKAFFALCDQGARRNRRCAARVRTCVDRARRFSYDRCAPRYGVAAASESSRAGKLVPAGGGRFISIGGRNLRRRHFGGGDDWNGIGRNARRAAHSRIGRGSDRAG